ncbi:MAG: 50S ribosomal protein L18 [Bacteroidetes bacterium]|nr:50S ribosomal protein L18 [Bacteroidota bacterium]
MLNSKVLRRIKIKKRVRGKISGSSEKPRLSVFRSNNEIYAQLIDDMSGKTLLSFSSKNKEFASAGKTKSDKAFEVGKKIAENAKQNGIETIVFDRNGYLFHGRVKKLAEGARDGGLNF